MLIYVEHARSESNITRAKKLILTFKTGREFFKLMIRKCSCNLDTGLRIFLTVSETGSVSYNVALWRVSVTVVAVEKHYLLAYLLTYLLHGAESFLRS